MQRHYNKGHTLILLIFLFTITGLLLIPHPMNFVSATIPPKINILVLFGNENDLNLYASFLRSLNRQPEYTTFNVSFTVQNIENQTYLASLLNSNVTQKFHSLWILSSLNRPFLPEVLDLLDLFTHNNIGIFIMGQQIRWLNVNYYDILGLEGIYSEDINAVLNTTEPLQFTTVTNQLNGIFWNTTTFYFTNAMPVFVELSHNPTTVPILALQNEIIPKNLNTSTSVDLSFFSGIYFTKYLGTTPIIVSTFSFNLGSAVASSANTTENRTILRSTTHDYNNVDNITPFKPKLKLFQTNDDTDNFFAFLSTLLPAVIITTPSVSSPIQIDLGQSLLIQTGIGIVILAGLVAILLKMGVFSKLKDMTSSIAVGFIFFIAHMAYSPTTRRITERELLKNPIRQAIIEILEERKESGAHLRELKKAIQCSTSSLLWHLQTLVDFGLVIHEKVGRYRIFYLAQYAPSDVDATHIQIVFKSESAKKLCNILLRSKKPLRLTELSKAINTHHETLRYHLKKMTELGIVAIINENGKSYYYIPKKRQNQIKSILERMK